MTHYWVNYGSVFRESQSKLRLDPCHLSPIPQSICYKGRQSGRYFTAFLTERGIFIEETSGEQPAKRRSNAARAVLPQCAPRSGQAAAESKVLKVFSPRQFLGIAACKISFPAAIQPANDENAAGVRQEQTEQKAFCLLLLHQEADYSVPLLISAGKDDVLLDWRLWADSYNLPMLIEEDGRFRLPNSAQGLKLFINDHKMRLPRRQFSLRCHGLSLNTRLVLANQVMLG